MSRDSEKSYEHITIDRRERFFRMEHLPGSETGLDDFRHLSFPSGKDPGRQRDYSSFR